MSDAAVEDRPIREVRFDEIVAGIEAFNASGANPYGPNEPVEGHAPLTVQVIGVNIEVEFPYHPHQRSQEILDFLAENPSFMTRRSVLYVSTRALIQRQWHRFYAYDIASKTVTGVKLLVTAAQDPKLFKKHPTCSAHPWRLSMVKSPIPVALDDTVEDIIPVFKPPKIPGAPG